MFGDINWVDPKSSCASEMVYSLYKEMKVNINRDIALLIYVGILTDTGSFRYSNTTSLTHKITSELLTKNLDTVEIYKNIYENLTFYDKQLLNQILLTMKNEAAGRIIWFKIKKGILENKKFNFDLSEKILSFGRAIKGCEVVILFKENFSKVQEVRVNLRSQGKIDVNRIASFFGGGGHKTASGCTISGTLDSTIRKVIRRVKKVL
jgi:phosphoesterase RecJ-like protein